MLNSRFTGLMLSVALIVPTLASAQDPILEKQTVPLSQPGEISAPTQPVRQEQQTVPPPQKEEPRSMFNDEGGEERVEYVDPREIKDVLRQISQQKSEVKRLVKLAQKQKMTQAVDKLQTILSQVAQHEQAIRAEGSKLTRDILQEFYDTQLWEGIEEIRYQVQLPQELKQIGTELKRAESLLKQKTTAAIPNLNLEAVRVKVAEARTAYEQATKALASGDTDAIKDAMETFWQNGNHPGEITGVLNQLRDIATGLKRVKAPEIREVILDILSPVYDSINDGDFREARMLLEDIRQELFPLMKKVEKSKNIDSSLQKKIQQLEQKLENRLEQQSGKKDGDKAGGVQSYVPFWYNQRASIFAIVYSWFADLW